MNWFRGRYRHISFPGHGYNVVTCLQFDTDKIVSGSDDQSIHVYETGTGVLRRKMVGHEGKFRARKLTILYTRWCLGSSILEGYVGFWVDGSDC